MEVADSAPRHGVSDGDIRAAVSVPLRVVSQGGDRVLVIGADTAGRLLEVVVLDPDGGSGRDPRDGAAPEVLPVSVTGVGMPRTREELERAAADAEAWLDGLDPAAIPAEDPADLRRIGLALRGVADEQRAVEDAVAAARGNGRSWAEIGLILGVSRQAARERYAHPAVHR